MEREGFQVAEKVSERKIKQDSEEWQPKQKNTKNYQNQEEFMLYTPTRH